MGGRGGSSGMSQTRNTISVSGLPNLTGSEKQIKWAEQIREDAINTVNRNIKNAEEQIKKSPGSRHIFETRIEAYAEVGRQLKDAIQKFTSASQLIEKRSFFTGSEINRLVTMVENQIRKRR